jgi:cell division protein FtsW
MLTNTVQKLSLRGLWLIPLFLFAVGIIEMYSASKFKAVELKGNEVYFLILHSLWVVAAIIIAVVTSFVSTNMWKRFANVMYYVTVFLLIGVFFFPSENGSHRWFPITGEFNIQPSEFAKITMIIYGAYLLETFSNKSFKTYKEHFNKYFLPILIRIGIPILLVVFEPDLGTAVVMFVSFAIMYILKENKFLKQDMMLLSGIGILGLVVFSLIQAYRVTRIQTYLDLLFQGKIFDEFGSGYQLRNILIAVGSGGWLGKGIGQSRQRFGYLVEVTAFTDSIIAVIFEELGFILSTIFMALYVLYFHIITLFAESKTQQFLRLVLWGFAGWMISQTFIHISANLGLIPVKGIPLPFITYGGSSITAIGIAAGIIFRFARSQN